MRSNKKYQHARGSQFRWLLAAARLPDGSILRLDDLDAWRIMEAIGDWGLPVKAECGGACARATCHVWVSEKWHGKLAPPTDEETEMLDGAFEGDGNARLSCQLIVPLELGGLEVELAAESLTDGDDVFLSSKPLATGTDG